MSNLFDPFQRALKEKEFELISIKNQKLENLCRALQEERKSLFQKVQVDPDVNAAEPTDKEAADVGAETPKDVHPAQTTAAPAPAPIQMLETPLTQELAKLKAEEALLKEMAVSFTISHVIPTETGDSQSQGLLEVVQEPEENHMEQSNGEQEAEKAEYQEQRDLEMESVD